MKVLVFAVSAVFLATPAFAQDSQSPSATSQPRNTEAQTDPAGGSQAGVPVGERRVCRRIDDTGSRIGGRRVCMTNREWREYDRGQ